MGKYNYLEDFLRGTMMSPEIFGRNISDVFDDEWESQTLLGILENLLRTITARLNSITRMLLWALEKCMS